MQNEEGGVVEEEFRVAYVVDRVNTFGTAFLGLTFDCTRCHDHKYDPLTQKDFYSLFSFFQNIDESGQTSYFTASMPVPTLLLSDDATDAKLAALRRQIAAKEKQLAAERDKARPAFADWLRKRPKELMLSGLVGSFSFEDIKANQIVNGADAKKPGHGVEGPKLVPGKLGKAVELNGENGFTFPGIGHFSRVDPFSLSLWLRPPSHAPRFVVVHHSKAPIDAGSRGYELLLENGRVAFGLHHMWPGNSLKVVTKSALPIHAWTHVTVTYDGSSRAAGVRIYLDGAPVEVEVVRDGLCKDITYEGGEPDLALGFRFRDNGFKGGQVDEFRIFNRAITALEAAHLAGQPEAATHEHLFDYFLSTAHAPALKTPRGTARPAAAGESDPSADSGSDGHGGDAAAETRIHPQARRLRRPRRARLDEYTGCPAALPDRSAAQSSRPGALADRPRTSADRARCRESPVAADVR